MKQAVQTKPVTSRFAAFWQALPKAIKRNAIPTAIMSVLWMVLWWLKFSGIQWAILWPFQFLTGALNGLTGNAFGGALGRTILLILFNSFFCGILANTGNRKKRMKEFGKQAKEKTADAVLEKIPYSGQMKTILSLRTPQAFGFCALGLSAALSVYPFITGDGALVNSMVCAAIFISLVKQLASHRGMIISILNYFLAKKSLAKIDRTQVNRVVAGFTLGMALSVGVAALPNLPNHGYFLWRICAETLPRVLLVLALIGIFWTPLAPLRKALAGLVSKLVIFIKNRKKTTADNRKEENAK